MTAFLFFDFQKKAFRQTKDMKILRTLNDAAREKHLLPC